MSSAAVRSIAASVFGSLLLQSEAGNLRNRSSWEQPSCPPECAYPVCQSGFEPYEGWQELLGSKCFARCSAAQRGGTRYCGSGRDFQGHGSIDCSGCASSATIAKTADFSQWTEYGEISGNFRIEKSDNFVQWEVGVLHVEDKLVSKFCGRLKDGFKPTFNYHMHEFWPHAEKSAIGDGCSLENIGNHWDPTAACGPASGNPVCDKEFCDTRGMGYTCDSWKFDPASKAQYRLLTPSALFPNGVTCEFGDFSGMAGPIQGVERWRGGVTTEVHTGKASMSATFGEISPETLDSKPCNYGTLPMASERESYELASKRFPLDQFPKHASVLVHCGSGYENANARFFCARLD